MPTATVTPAVSHRPVAASATVTVLAAGRRFVVAVSHRSVAASATVTPRRVALIDANDRFGLGLA
jgi:hypothetical protein